MYLILSFLFSINIIIKTNTTQQRIYWQLAGYFSLSKGWLWGDFYSETWFLSWILYNGDKNEKCSILSRRWIDNKEREWIDKQMWEKEVFLTNVHVCNTSQTIQHKTKQHHQIRRNKMDKKNKKKGEKWSHVML